MNPSVHRLALPIRDWAGLREGRQRQAWDGLQMIAFWGVTVKSADMVQQAPGSEGCCREGPAEPWGGRKETSEHLSLLGTAVERPTYYRAVPSACPGEASDNMRIRTDQLCDLGEALRLGASVPSKASVPRQGYT